MPYPFGISPGCYWPGLNLTCDPSGHGPPRLLLDDGTFRVTNIYLDNSTLVVVRTSHMIINSTGVDITTGDHGWMNFSFGGGSFNKQQYDGYMLSGSNELVVSGCNVVVKLLGDMAGERTTKIISSCASFCTTKDIGLPVVARTVLVPRGCGSKWCGSGNYFCCQAPLSISSWSIGVQIRWLYSGNHTAEQQMVPVNAFVAVEGMVRQDPGGRQR